MSCYLISAGQDGVWEPSPGSLGEKHFCQQWPEREMNRHSSSATLYCASYTLWKWSGISFNCVIRLFTLTRDKIGGFSQETTHVNHFRIRVSEAILDICACGKHSVT